LPLMLDAHGQFAPHGPCFQEAGPKERPSEPSNYAHAKHCGCMFPCVHVKKLMLAASVLQQTPATANVGCVSLATAMQSKVTTTDLQRLTRVYTACAYVGALYIRTHLRTVRMHITSFAASLAGWARSYSRSHRRRGSQSLMSRRRLGMRGRLVEFVQCMLLTSA
jgi:hypothetical protein